MKRIVSPGVLWAAFLMISMIILSKTYQIDKANIFKFHIGYILILVTFFICALYTYFFDRGKSRAASLASFLFGLGFWIPLLNLIFAIPALYFGIASIRKIKKKPEQYGGKWFAVIGIVLGALVYLTYYIGVAMCVSGNREICSSMGLAFLSK